MAIHKIRIKEVLVRELDVEANTIAEALQKVEQDYFEEQIILDSDDYLETIIEAVEA